MCALVAKAFPIRSAWLVRFVFALSLVVGHMPPNTHASPLESLQRKLPSHAGPWTAAGEDRFFDAETLFGYINGAAEVYRAYNLRQCLSRHYLSTGGPSIILDIFDMGSAEDAYGVFTHDLDGEKMAIGQDGRLRPGWLSFWKDRFFVSIYMEEETQAAQNAVIELGRQVAASIDGTGARPELIFRLPTAGLQTDRIRYLHHPIVLNFHYYLSDENLLDISRETDVALADYRFEDQTAILLLVQYPTVEKAIHSRAHFLKYYMPDANARGVALLENDRWAAIRREDNLVAIVLEADSAARAEALLDDVRWDFRPSAGEESMPSTP